METMAHFIPRKITGSRWIKYLSSLRSNHGLLLIAILLLAAFLRLYKIGDYMTFLGDEGRDALAVKSILEGDLVFLGPRSSAADFYYGPIYFYFITPFMWLFQYDPVGPAVFIGILGILTVYLVYYVASNLFSRQAGLFAAALYAVSPLVIAYSRSSWNPNPLPFVALLTLYMLYKAVEKSDIKRFIVAGLLFGIAMQLQYIALFLGVVIFLFTITGTYIVEKKLILSMLLRRYLLMFGGFLVSMSPFLAFEVKNNFPNLRTIFNYIFVTNSGKGYEEGASFIGNITSVFFKLFARLMTRFPPPEQINITESTHLQIWQLLTVTIAIIAIVALFKVKNRLTVLLFSLWLCVSVFLFGFYKKEIYDYYVGFMFTLPFLLVGNALGQLYIHQRAEYLGKIMAVALFLLLFVFNLDGNPFKYPPNRQKDQVKQIAEFVLSKTDGNPYNFALLTPGNSDHGYRYFFSLKNHEPVTIENTAIDPERKSVTDQLLIVCEDPNCQPLGNSLWEVAGFGRAQIAGEWQVSVVKVYKLVHYNDEK